MNHMRRKHVSKLIESFGANVLNTNMWISQVQLWMRSSVASVTDISIVYKNNIMILLLTFHFFLFLLIFQFVYFLRLPHKMWLFSTNLVDSNSIDTKNERTKRLHQLFQHFAYKILHISLFSARSKEWT